MSTPTELVEQYATDGFKRQLEQEENIVRSLPFFAASLTLLGTVFGYAGRNLEPFQVGCMPSVLGWGFAGATLILVSLVVIGLLGAVWPRQYLYPIDEEAFAAYASELEHQISVVADQDPVDSPTGVPMEPAVEVTVTKTLRERLIREYAESATWNRRINGRRQRSRSLALICLVLAIAVAILAGGTTFASDHMNLGVACHAVQ
jgi:hypothetical protein